MSWDREKERRAGKAMTVGSCVFGLIFSVFWCVMAVSMGAGFMLIFGIPFAGLMGYRLYVLLQLSKGQPKEHTRREAEPWERPVHAETRTDAAGSGYCPYCGSSVETEFAFCPKCGRKLK